MSDYVWRRLLAGCLVAGCFQLGAQDASSSWLKFSGDFRARAEFVRSAGFERALNDSYYLNRVRLRANLEPREWLRATVEFQDARAPGILNAEGFADRNDVRLAYLALGRARSGWELTIGRQEIPLGDERLAACGSSQSIDGDP